MRSWKKKSEVPQSSTMIEAAPRQCINVRKPVHLKYVWNISNFDENFITLESPIFSNGKNMECRLMIDSIQPSSFRPQSQFGFFPFEPFLFPDDSTEETVYCVKIMVVSCDARSIQFLCKFQLLSTIPTNTFIRYKHFRSNLGRYMECMQITRSIITFFLEDNSITLTCEINAMLELSMPHTMPKCTLFDDCEAIFENQEFTDFTFYVSDKEFQVHKAILAARSPVFKAMLQQNMKESKDNSLELREVDQEVFGELLRFVYTGKVRNLNEIAFDLLQLADLYQLKDLKMLCAEELCINISVENALAILILANLHSLDLLKIAAMVYIGRHAVDVSKTERWNDMIRLHPELFSEVLTYASIQLLMTIIS